MKQIIAIVLAVALAACGPLATPNAPPQGDATSSKPETQVAAAPTPAPTAPETPVSDKPPASAPTTLSPAMLVGRWGDNGDCTKDIVINADGTFRSYTGGGGNWSLRGDRMAMTGANGTFEVGVALRNQNTLVITNPDGSVGTSQRC